ncbi:Nn.00g037410.m01.CDS01 [Neocucurbitaria sp. VM-36]
MNLPTIRVEDCTSQPSVTVRYLSGNNDLDFKTVYTQIKRLLTHPKCEHFRVRGESWPCMKCEQAFENVYWSCAAYLLDYFADFYNSDTPLMQSVWFHLLDVWQEGGTWLPFEAFLNRVPPSSPQTLTVNRAAQFVSSVKETIALFDLLLSGPRAKGIPRDPIIHPPSGEADSPAGEYDTGPWLSGLKPWQQFLCAGSPGVASPPHSLLPSCPDEGAGASAEEAETQSTPPIRHIPMSAIAIIHRHTTRTRSLAAKLATSLDPDTVVEALHTFDQHALKFPTSTHTQSQTHTYTSPLTGRSVTYQLTNGAPLIGRYIGLGDPSMLVSSPTWTLADECVGVCRGWEAYEPQGGGQGQGQGQGQGDDEEEEEEEEEDVFDMWSVCESAVVEEGEGKGVLVEGWGEMFKEWSWMDEI